MSKVLGIDPGTARTGWGVVKRDGNQAQAVAFGCIETSAGEDAQQRLEAIARELREVVREHAPDSLAIEKLYFQTNVKTAMSVSEARGVALLVGAETKLPVAEYTGLQVKQSVAGYGQADKKQVAAMVCKQLGLKETPKPDDVTDALAIALTHAFWRAT